MLTPCYSQSATRVRTSCLLCAEPEEAGNYSGAEAVDLHTLYSQSITQYQAPSYLFCAEPEEAGDRGGAEAIDLHTLLLTVCQSISSYMLLILCRAGRSWRSRRSRGRRCYSQSVNVTHSLSIKIKPHVAFSVQSRKKLEIAAVQRPSEDLGRDMEKPRGNSWRPAPNANENIAKEAYGASWPMQFQILLQRTLKVRRFETLKIQDVGQYGALAVLAGELGFRAYI